MTGLNRDQIVKDSVLYHQIEEEKPEERGNDSAECEDN